MNVPVVYKGENTNGAIVPAMARDTVSIHSAEELAEPGLADLAKRVHLLLRGRYLLVIAVCIIAGAAGAILGFRSGEITYRSAGQIRVSPTLPRVLYGDDEKGVMPMFDSFVDTQVMLLRSQRLLEMGLDDPEWQALRPGKSDVDLTEFQKGFTFERQNEIVTVAYISTDPGVSTAAVKSLIRAYQRLFMEQDARKGEQRLELLQQRQAALTSEEKSAQQRLMAIASKYGTEKIDGLYQAKLEEMLNAETEIRRLEAAEAEAKRVNEAVAQGELPEPTRAQLVAANPIIAQREQQVLQLEEQLLLGGLGAEHPDVKRTERRIEIARKELANAESQAREFLKTTGSRVSSGPVVTFDPARLVALRDYRERVRTELSGLGQENIRLQELRQEADDAARRLGETTRRIEQLTVEAPVADTRISIVSDGDRPLGPWQDTRIKFGIAGGLASSLAGVSLVIGLLTLNQRHRSAGEVPLGKFNNRLLGILPHVPDDLSDPDQAAMVAHSIHEIRTLLQVQINHDGPVAWAITSPESGSGKTALSLALGASYAAAGYQTLLIDFDLVGQGLSTRTGAVARRRIGDLLRETGVRSEDIERAASARGNRKIKLGETCVRLGLLSQLQLDEALHTQQTHGLGVIDALHGEPLANCTVEAGVENLSLLTVGTSNRINSGQLAPESFRQLIQLAKIQYDIILVDTGPLPGSLEAAVAAPIVDGTIVVIAHGQRRGDTLDCLERLRALRARIAGAVYNRASTSDSAVKSSYRTRSSTMSRRNGTDTSSSSGWGLKLDPQAARSAQKMGPVAQAVVGTSSNSKPDET
jgi:Mrp family chromosome partitioning ATPase/uncharacterized protein involved in exopolysaccharide biosynthesis